MREIVIVGAGAMGCLFAARLVEAGAEVTLVHVYSTLQAASEPELLGWRGSQYPVEPLRDYLESQPWDKTPPAPALPPQVVAGTRQRYLDAYRLLTGRELAL